MSTGRAIVVGSGPNGLAGAVTLARAGLAVTVFEQSEHLGGGAATRELTLSGFRHDVGSAVHPMAVQSAFFRRFGLDRRIELLTPELSYGHALTETTAALAWRDLERTAQGLGADASTWRRLLWPLAADADRVADVIGGAVLPPAHPVVALRLGLRALEQGSHWWNREFLTEAAPALLTGVIAHTNKRLPALGAAAPGLVLAAFAHARGWPVPRGGSGAITQALADDLIAHGGRIETGVEIEKIDEVADADAVLFDVTPRAFARIAGDRLPTPYRVALQRFRYGDGIAKVDFALSEPVPWAAAELREAVTVHVGGTRADLARAEGEVASGRLPTHPYLLVSQPSVIDDTRAPAGKHVLWAYTHVPAGATDDRTDAITAEIERFAPGFRDTVLASAGTSARDLEQLDPNLIGGDIAAGATSTWQLVGRPLPRREPWRTPLPGVFLCGASTAPGPGVHGQSGWQAARLALRGLHLESPDLAPPGVRG
ncbi:phytoene desaturase family protein [Gryllotalpicola protaetiae]|uniref:Pyridine nucleotide-disulfide oxidoreductase domain-containing protein 2 n=1 Tax=Gryllotalpicola protaetiae TaxID=2419771 RepID=A0A387BV10_9MICO|nr:NAD(P)/FAD-dependent oxidoreductase [Gryllotalpicola protaetiae]AYG04707.1 NAD(P)/FAD-dependent oxidoreductase [Gryllotalpicola protaetiae]